jgi:predicted nucleic acid-binding Zn ribbon protein
MQKECKNCGRTYEAKTQRSQFCSDRCRAAFHMRKKRTKEKKWYRAKMPFWYAVLITLMGVVALSLAIDTEMKKSRLEKKLEQYQDSIRTLPKKYQAKFPGDTLP